MKFKIIASAVIVAVLLLVLALKSCSNSAPSVDENGNPIPTETQPQQ